MPRLDLLQGLARELGYGRLGANIKRQLNSVIRSAAIRGLITSSSNGISITIGSLHDATRETLKDVLLAAMGKTWHDRAEVAGTLTAHAGFGRVSAKTRQLTASLVSGLIRERRLESNGDKIRRIR